MSNPNTFKAKLGHFDVLNLLPKVKLDIESASSDILANLKVIATYTYLGMNEIGKRKLSRLSNDEVFDLSDKVIGSFVARDLSGVAESNMKFVNAQLEKQAPEGIYFKVGDVVTFTNCYGVSFHNRLVVGFDLDGRIYTAGEAYWYGSEANMFERVS